MDKKLIVLVLVALLGGLGGGYGLGHVIYQPQIQNLQSGLNDLNSEFQGKLDNMDDRVANLENRSWHKVYSIIEYSNITSRIFQLKGKEIRVMWSAEGQSPLSWLSITLHYSNGTVFSFYGSSGIWAVINAEEELKQPGQYYLGIASYQMDYIISLWDYY